MVHGANPPMAIFEGFLKLVWGHLGIAQIARMTMGLMMVRFNDEATRDSVLENEVIQFDRKLVIDMGTLWRIAGKEKQGLNPRNQKSNPPIPNSGEFKEERNWKAPMKARGLKRIYLKLMRLKHCLKKFNHEQIWDVGRAYHKAKDNFIEAKYHAETNPSDWPVACCSTIYKCISKLLCARLAVVLPILVHHNQRAFVQGRAIAHNVMILQDILKNYRRKNVSPRCTIKIDISKAYDTVDWSQTSLSETIQVVVRQLAMWQVDSDLVTLSNNHLLGKTKTWRPELTLKKMTPMIKTMGLKVTQKAMKKKMLGFML
uniref:Reverse transcriptase domain-containing protein n=1 Tax=Cannabis sativa TaxID=3483 RepID=A0A803NRK1_CANSA